jgi:hypothetical protein
MKIVVLTIFFILSLTSVFCQTIDCNSNNPLLTPSESDIMNIIFRNGNIDFDFVNKKMSFANLQNDVMYFSSIRKACYNYYLSNKKSFLRNMDTTKTNFRNSYKLILLSETEKIALAILMPLW